MMSDGNNLSDERIGEAVIKQVTQELVNNASPEAVPPIASQEQKIVNQLSRMIRKVGDTYGNNTEFQDAIDSVARSSGCKWNKFKKVTEKVFEDGITWEKIAVLFYVAGKLALKMVEAHFPQTVKEILRWTVDFFKNNLLGWIREHGGWINSFSELASLSMQSSHSYNLVLFFVSGLTLGSFITWSLNRHL